MENLGLNATADVSSEQAAIWRLIGSNGSHCELSFTKIGAGFGFLGDIQIVKFAKDGLKIVAKRCEIPDGLPEPIASFFAASQPHQRECAFYRAVMDTIRNHCNDQILVPRGALPSPSGLQSLSQFCKAASTGRQGGSDFVVPPLPFCFSCGEILLLEYVESYSSPSFYNGMSAKDVVATMTSLAQIHVITSQYVETTPCIDNSLRPYGSGLYDLESLKTKCTAFCELVAQPGVACTVEMEQLLREGVCAEMVIHLLAAAEEKYPKHEHRTIIHGDLWASNVMFHSEYMLGTRDILPVILDFQFAVLGHPAEDISVLLCTSVDSSVRRKSLGLIVDSYNTARREYWHKLGNESCLLPDITIDDCRSFLVHGLLLILLSFETWVEACVDDEQSTAALKKNILLQRFVGVIEDVLRM